LLLPCVLRGEPPTSFALRLLDAVEMLLRSQEDRVPRHRQRRERALADVVSRELFLLGAGLEDRRDAFLAREVDAARSADRRGRILTWKTRAPALIAAPRVEAGGDAVVADDVDLVRDEERRRVVWHAAPDGPCDVRLRHLALAAGPDREERGAIVTGGDEDEAVTEDGSRNDGVAIGITHVPERVAALRIVGDHAVRRAAHELLASGRLDEKRRREGETTEGLPWAILPPEDLSRRTIERGDELLVAAVAVDDEGATGERGRPAASVDRSVAKLLVPPEDLAFGVERRGAVRSEVDVDALAICDRRRARVAVLV